MVQKKSFQAIESYNLKPETRFLQQQEHHHLKILGPEMMMMKKRTKPKKKVNKDTTSSLPPSSKQQPSPQQQKHHQDLVGKVTGGSPNYMKGTSSSEARKENKKRFSLSKIHKNQADNNNKKKLSSKIVRGLTKTPSFKRSSQRAPTCSSTLKDSKFPEYLMLNHGETHDEVSRTSVLRVCPYTYCSLNGHHHKSTQYPPLKSFISSRRRSLKSQKNVKKEASKEEMVEMYVVEKKECEEDGNKEAFEVYIDTQISETFSDGAPCSETDSDDNFSSEEMVKEMTLVDETMKDIQETSEVDGSIQEAPCSDLEETLVDDDYVKEITEKGNREGDDSCFDSEVTGMMNNSTEDNASEEDEDDADEETLEDKDQDCKEESQDGIEVVSMMIEETTKVPCNQEEADGNSPWTIIKCKKPIEETDDPRGFNPREPNYLPIVADPDAEKVDLKHQDMDDRRNSEDWMIDYALQRAVSKLSSAERKRKVALLVEAFETVQPIKPHGRHLQACN